MLTVANSLPALSVFCILQTSFAALSLLTILIGVRLGSKVLSPEFIFIGYWLLSSQEDLPSTKTVPHSAGKAHVSLR